MVCWPMELRSTTLDSLSSVERPIGFSLHLSLGVVLSRFSKDTLSFVVVKPLVDCPLPDISYLNYPSTKSWDDCLNLVVVVRVRSILSSLIFLYIANI